ncbi:MAG: glycoside hydrolase family 65 protein [Clostridia bacterium]|nr:glycoside hydrolase family 65 protein [Clostridia bacterium]
MIMKYDLGQNEKENWLVAETAFEPAYQGKCEAIFCSGNGYLGQRAALEERYVGQTRDLLVTGTFNSFAPNEVTELPNLPDVTNLEFFVDGVRFAMDAHNTSDYLRVLDLKTGEVKRTLTWTHPDGRRFALCFTRFASMDNEHILGLKASITALDGDANITVVSGIDGRVTSGGSQHFLDGDKRIFDNTILRMSAKTIQSGVTCCLHSAHDYAIDGQAVQGKLLPIIDRRYMAMKSSFAIEAGKTLTVTKLTAVTTSRDLAYHGLENAAELALEEGLSMLKAAKEKGYDKLFAASCEKWAALWKEADVKIDSARAFDQLTIRFALYHLNIMIKKDDSRVGIGAKGMTGEGYKGHSFWDTEIFILPYFTLTQPEAARTLLEYRYRGLYGARKKAIENGYEGAMYPWEAAWIDDGEVTPLWGAADIVTGKPIKILTGIIEQHITADVSFGVSQYYAVTGDQDFMDKCGYEILIDTARFWASRPTWDEEKGKYVILGVIGPDEYKEHVDNNAYTNYMAAYNMELGLKSIEALEKRGGEVYERLNAQLDFVSAKEKIAHVLSNLYLPQPDENGIIPQFDGYMNLKHIDLTPYKQASVVGTIYNDYNQDQICTFQVHKQADTLVLLLLRDDLLPADQKTKNYYFYESRTLHDSSLSKSTHCVLAADLHEDKTAYDFFVGCGNIDLGGAMTTSDMGVHTASMGGIWQCVTYGFGGVRVVGDALHVNPRLPENWNSLELPLTWRGQTLRMSADKQGVSLTNTGDAAVTVVLCGNSVEIKPGETVKA